MAGTVSGAVGAALVDGAKVVGVVDVANVDGDTVGAGPTVVGVTVGVLVGTAAIGLVVLAAGAVGVVGAGAAVEPGAAVAGSAVVDTTLFDTKVVLETPVVDEASDTIVVVELDGDKVEDEVDDDDVLVLPTTVSVTGADSVPQRAAQLRTVAW